MSDEELADLFRGYGYDFTRRGSTPGGRRATARRTGGDPPEIADWTWSDGEG